VNADPPANPGADQTVTFPADHSFVVQFRPGSGSSGDGPWVGRVEHIVSGDAARFDDWHSLRTFVVRILRGRRPVAGGADPEEVP
jgi:hypothetical protein